MKTIELKPGLYWCGVLDPELRVFDIIMKTQFGTTYNSYILKGSDKTALIEACKAPFWQGYKREVEQIADLKDIDYIVVSHTEPDHSGTLEKILEINPNVKIVATQAAITNLKYIVHREFYSIAVKDGDTLDLGGVTLTFLPLPNLHWPDTMFTYVDKYQALITCDAFGAHYSSPAVLYSELTGAQVEEYQHAARYYFDNIIGPFAHPFMTNAIERIKELDIDMILTGHGPVLDTSRAVADIRAFYDNWCRDRGPNAKKTVVIPYVSAYGYTKQLADDIERGLRDSGDIEVRRYDMVSADAGAVLDDIVHADGILFGTPTIVGDALKPIWDLTTSLHAVAVRGKHAAAFGSYGWSGEGVPNITARLEQLRFKVADGLRVRFKPDDKDRVDAYDFGYNFGCLLQNKENKRSASKRMVKCLVCGAVLEESAERCPVCGVGPENFVPIEEEAGTFKNDTKQRYLILGAGAAALSAATAIRRRDTAATVTMVAEEEHLPYNRPMLTKTMFAELARDSIAVHNEKWYADRGITLLRGQQVTALDTKAKKVRLASGKELDYDKCVYALGSSSFVPPIKGVDLPEVVTIHTADDVAKLTRLLKRAKSAVVIGGGVLGLETAWELAKANCEVSVIETLHALLYGKIAPEASAMLEDIADRKGVNVETSAFTEEILGEGHVEGVKLKDGRIQSCDIVVVSTGVRPNIAVAEQAGLRVDSGVIVDDHMRTSAPDVWACGDCAELDGINHCLWAQATGEGDVAGANAAGDEAAYSHTPPAVTLNIMGTALYAAGDNGCDADTAYKTAEFTDTVKQQISKYYFLNNKLVGATLLGDTAGMAKVQDAVTRGAQFIELFN